MIIIIINDDDDDDDDDDYYYYFKTGEFKGSPTQVFSAVFFLVLHRNFLLSVNGLNAFYNQTSQSTF